MAELTDAQLRELQDRMASGRGMPLPNPLQPRPEVSAPEVNGNMADVLAAQTAIQQQAGRQGGPNSGTPLEPPSNKMQLPLVARTIAEMISPTKPGATSNKPANLAMGPERPSRVDSFHDFLGQFITSFAQGLMNAGTGSAANARGFGAAVMAPQQMNQQNYQQQLQQQAAQQAQQQTAELNRSLIQQRGTQSVRNMAQAEAALNPPARPDTSITELDLWRQQNPGKPITEFFKLKAGSGTVTNQDEAINDWIASKNLPNTPANRDKARADIAKRNRPEPGSYQILTDDKGNVVGAWNPKTGGTAPTPQSLEGSRRSGLAGTELTRRGMLQGMAEDMATAAEMAEQFRNTLTIGKGTGWLGSVKRSIFGGNTEAISLERILNNSADILLRARSGAQINEQEYRRLRGLLPNLNESEDSFFTKLADFQKEVNRLLKSTVTPGNSGTKPPSANSKDPLGLF